MEMLFLTSANPMALQENFSIPQGCPGWAGNLESRCGRELSWLGTIIGCNCSNYRMQVKVWKLSAIAESIPYARETSFWLKGLWVCIKPLRFCEGQPID